MNFIEHEQRKASSFTRIAVVILAHALLLIFAVNHVRTSAPKIPERPILQSIPAEPPKITPQEQPKPFDERHLTPQMPTVPDLPPVNTDSNPPPNDHGAVKGDPDVIIGGPSGGGISGSTGSGGGTATLPIHHAAVVDAKACDKPEYPAASARNNETGVVTLSMLIGIDGRVLDSQVLKSSGHRALDRAARQGLSLCQFKPGNTDGVPEQSWTKIQYSWTLD